MSVFVPVSNGLAVTLEFVDQNGDIGENTFWVKRTSAWTLSLIDTMAAAFVTWFGTGDGTHSYKLYTSNFSELSAVACRDHTTINGFSTVYQTGLPIVGLDSSGPASPGLTKSFTLRSGLAGKNYRGRIYTNGFNVGAISNIGTNVVTTTYLTGMVDALTSLLSAIPAADVEASWVIVSRFYQPGGPGTPSVPRAAGVETPVLSVGYANALVDFQRRRAPGHARHH